jgi:hypothetical protein
MAKKKQKVTPINTSAYAERNFGVATQQKMDEARAASKASWAPDFSDPDVAWSKKPVGPKGETQAQLDAAAGAADVVKSINENYSGLGITSKIDPKTGMVVTTKGGNLLTNNAPGSAFSGLTDDPDKPEKKEISDATRDAFAALTDLFASYGLRKS